MVEGKRFGPHGHLITMIEALREDITLEQMFDTWTPEEKEQLYVTDPVTGNQIRLRVEGNEVLVDEGDLPKWEALQARYPGIGGGKDPTNPGD